MLSLFSLMACQQSNKSNTNQTDSTQVKKTDVSLKDTKKSNILQAYILLKDALVSSDAIKAKTAASDLQKTLASYPGCEPTAEVVAKIANSADLKTQRKNFITLSADVIPLIKHSDVESGTIYVQHCPMAADGKGADWLSTDKDIKNPYYGDEMLTCGKVTEEIKAK